MENSELPGPHKLFQKILVKLYRPTPSAWGRYSGRSPLDIPQSTVALSFLVASFLALILGNLYINLEHALVYRDLHQIEQWENVLPGAQDEDLVYAITGLLLPHWKARVAEADVEVVSAIEESFSDKKITIAAIAQFAGPEVQPTELETMIVGPLARSWWTLKTIPYFAPESPDVMADQLGLYRSYGEEGGQISTATWKRFLFISAVQYLRNQMDNGISRPRRRLLALGGGIQWITFIGALWCLIMLLLLRVPWCKLQNHLTQADQLPWHDPGFNVWNKLSGYFSRLQQDYPGMFIPVRLIRDVINIRESDPDASIYHVVRERITAYRDSVEVGEYEILNFLIWATPTFGFIGTIFGIILAMENAADIFSASTPVEQGIALDRVSAALGTAFDTSFIALIWLVPMSFFLARTRKLEANFFEDLEYKAISYLPPQFEEEEEAVASL
jgi:hypothetical protein